MCSPEIEVEFWYPGQYVETKVVPLERITCQLARTLYSDPDIWMTVALEKVRIIGLLHVLLTALPALHFVGLGNGQ